MEQPPQATPSGQPGELPFSRTVKAGPPPDDWKRHRGTIKRLYSDEGKTLRQVISIMENEYGHVGSVKMYKSRITKWKLDKKNKEDEMAIILRKKTERDAVGKANSFRLRGKFVDIEDVLRYCKRKGRNFRPALSDATTPSDMSFWTPERITSPLPERVPGAYDTSNSSFEQGHSQYFSVAYHRESNVSATLHDLSPSRLFPGIVQQISPPRLYLVQEELFTFIKAYIYRSFGTGIWILLIPEGWLLNTRQNDNEPGARATYDFMTYIDIAVEFMKIGRFVEAHQALCLASGYVESILVFENPRALEHYMGALLLLLGAGLCDVVALFQTHLCQMAAKVLQKDNPLRQVHQLIGSIEPEILPSLLGRSWLCLTDAIQSHLDSMHRDMLSIRLNYLARVVSVNDLLAAEQELRSLYSEWSRSIGQSQDECAEILVDLGYNLYKQGRYVVVDSIASHVLNHSRASVTQQEVKALQLMAFSQRAQSKFRLAEQNLRQATEKASTAWGRDHSDVIGLKVKLSTWLREAGRETELAELEAELAEDLAKADLGL